MMDWTCSTKSETLNIISNINLQNLKIMIVGNVGIFGRKLKYVSRKSYVDAEMTRWVQDKHLWLILVNMAN
jgi:hypothetical protein